MKEVSVFEDGRQSPGLSSPAWQKSDELSQASKLIASLGKP